MYSAVYLELKGFTFQKHIFEFNQSFINNAKRKLNIKKKLSLNVISKAMSPPLTELQVFKEAKYFN